MGNAKWMSQIDDNTPISKLTIPGTHDSCSTNDFSINQIVPGIPNYTIKNSAKCQNLGLYEQLDIGIRAFDIRLNKTSDTTLTAWHGDLFGGVSQDDTFQEIIDICIDFLDDNPSESIFMFVKKEKGNDISSLVEQKINDSINYWYLQNELPETLQNVRGKIVLLNRFNSNYGIKFYDKWKDNDSFFTVNNSSQSYHIQDEYEDLGSTERDAQKTKFKAVEKMIERSRQSPSKDNFYFSFLSGVYARHILGVSVLIPDTMDIASGVNQKTMELLFDDDEIPVSSFLMMDFCDKRLCDILLDTNIYI